MENVLLLLFFPILVPIIAKLKWQHRISLQEVLIQIGVICLPILILIGIGYVGKQRDFEIWNGTVVNKTRVQGHYEDPYPCNCTRDKDGHETCQTCYEDRYTVTWKGFTTVGEILFKHLDSGSRSVYNTPDPAEYVYCKKGEPASIEHSFMNLVKASPDSLFNKEMSQSSYRIPSYPRVYSYYKINRVLNVDSKITGPEMSSLNTSLNKVLQTLGASKETNIIVILTENDDSNYRHIVENKWLGGKKNDIVVFFGLDNYKFTWVDVMTFGLNIGNESLHVQLREELLALKVFKIEEIVFTIKENVVKYYTRPKMKSFEYLRDAIELPSWVIIVSVIITILGSIFLTSYFYHNDVGSSRFYRNRYWRN